MDPQRTREKHKGITSRKIKPVYLMHQEGISDLEKKAVLDGASELIQLAEVPGINLIDFGVWRNKDYKNTDGSLKEYQSVDWYVQKGRETSRNKKQLNAKEMQDALMYEPWRYSSEGGHPHFDIFVVHEDIYYPKTNFFPETAFVIGVGGKDIGTTLSTYRFRGLDNKSRYECIKTETMHELGHVFGLIPPERTKKIEEKLGRHCSDICIMRQGLELPKDWINMTKDRLRDGALCPLCKDNLKEYFRK